MWSPKWDESAPDASVTENLAPAYLIVGDDPYLTSEALDGILVGIDEYAISEFAPEDDPSAILQALDTPSLFGARRVVVVRRVDEMLADVHRQLVSYLENPSASSCLILLSAKPLAKVAAAARKVGRVIETSRGKRTDLFSWLRDEAKKRGLKVTGDVMGALVEAIGAERMALVQAIDELALALGEGARIAPEDVRRQFQGRAEANLYGFVDAVAGRQAGPALEALHRLLRQGESAQALFWMVVRHFKMLMIAGDAPPASVAGDLGIPAWRAEKLVRQARNFSQTELVEAYRVLAAADKKIKKSAEPEELTLERAVVAVASR